MKRIFIILFLMMLIGTASAVSTLYLMPLNASEPMPNAKQSADTIHRDVAGAYASYTNPGILSETMGSTPLTRESTAAEAGAVHYTHYGTWVTNPLAAQWVNGTVTVNLTMRESSSSANVMPRLKIYRWYANDTKGSELRTIGNSATEVGTSYPATPIRYFNAVALTSTLFEEGDRIAVELESYDNNAVTTSWLHGIRYGGTAGNSSHIVFSQTLAYAPTKETIVYSGQRPINDKLSIISDSAARSTTLAVEMHKVVGAITLPYKFTDGTTEITIKKIELNVPDAKVGYYINAIRDGQEVHTHSPVWVVNSPYEVTQSESTNTLLNEKTITVKEDPQSAAQQVLSGYVSRQPLGKAEGDDVLIVYTSGSEDGLLQVYGVSHTFADIRVHAGSAATTDGTSLTDYLLATSSSGLYNRLYRAYFEFNTSGLPDDSTVDSAIVGLYRHAASTTALGTGSYGITRFVPATPGTAVAADFQTANNEFLSDTTSGWSSAGYQNYTLNSLGIANVSKTAYTNYVVRSTWDVTGDTTGLTWASSVDSGVYITAQEHTDPGDPFLEITYTPAAGGSAPVSSFTVNRPIARIPQVLTFTNTSTNIPTGWNWSWGDGTWTNGTTNNPTHQYKKRGIFPVFLLSSNAVGSNTSATQNIRVVGYENYW